jgi:hypothetical protein
VLTPERVEQAFHVVARPFRDPFNDTLRLSLAREDNGLWPGQRSNTNPVEGRAQWPPVLALSGRSDVADGKL